MKCRKCVRNIESDSRFCRHCGTKVVRVIGAGVNADVLAATRGVAVDPRYIRRSAPVREPLAVGAGSGKYAQATLEFREPEPAAPAVEPPAPSGDVYRDPQFEQHIWSGRPTWRAGTSSWILWFLLSAVSLYAASRYGHGDPALMQVVWIFVVGAAVTLAAREAIVVLGFSYQLTTQRLFVHRGILTRVTDQVELLRIDDVRLVQSITDRIVNSGSVDVFSSDETDENIMLRSISAPLEVAEAIRTHVRGARSKGTLSVERI